MAATVFLAAACGPRLAPPGHPRLTAASSFGCVLPPNYRTLSAVLARLSPSTPADASLRSALDTYLSALGRTGPRTSPGLFPTSSDALAYLVNAHVAWTIALGERRDLAGLDASAMRGIEFPLDGRTATLRTIEAELARRAPYEPRLALFLNPGWRGGPPLPESALEGASFEWQLARQALRCGAAGFWALDAGARTLAVSAFAGTMWGLPGGPVERARRLLELVPPPASLRDAIASTCGGSLERCAVTALPWDAGRLFGPGR